MKKFIVRYKEKKVKVCIENNALNNIDKYLNVNKRYFIITDDEVDKIYFRYLSSKLSNYEKHVIINGEKSKNTEEVKKIIDKLIMLSFTKDDYIIALGGGVVSDLSAFVASIYKRGIKLITIPTTLISQVDASLGGKTAIDYVQYKNIIGTIYHPEQIIVDPMVLNSLDDRNRRSGYSEIIKYAFSLNKKIYQALLKEDNLENIIYLSLKTKAKVTKKDEYDNNHRHVLNYGHTIGHCLESASDFQLLHGEAVAIGLLYETSKKYQDKMIALLKKYDLFKLIEINEKEIRKYIYQDKKISNNLIDRVIIDKIGKCHLKKVTIEEFLGEIK